MIPHMKRIYFLCLVLFLLLPVQAQTFHALLFSDMRESDERSPDRTAELNNMREFCENMANLLGYGQDIRCHSDNEFTSQQFQRDLETLRVGSSDVVVFFYNGHGCNWDDDDWPHMAFRDRQYWETTAYEKLQEKCDKAKLILCIACCCNMDSKGRSGYDLQFADNPDPNKARALFTGFSGKRRVITSSSIRGQYSYSWVRQANSSSRSRIGSIYGISLREAVGELLKSTSTVNPTWDNVLSLAKSKTLSYTGNKQLPQYKIVDSSSGLSARARRVLEEMRSVSSGSGGGNAGARIGTVTLNRNVVSGGIPSLVIDVDFSIDNLSSDGGRVVAFVESPRGTGVKDLNGKYCTTDGKVSVGRDFGTRRPSATFKGFQLVIPTEELHITDKSKTYYIRLGIYDYKSNRYIKTGDHIPL